LKFTNSSPKTIPNNISGEGKIVFAGTAKVAFTGKVDVDCNVVGSGELGGSAGIVKNDDGVLFVTATNTYTGATEINNGTVVLGAPNIPSEAPFAEDISVRLDASATSSIVCTEDDAVVEWHDADGRGIVYTQNAEAVECLPHLRSGVINSKPSIYFAGAMNRLTSTSVIKVKNVFAVYRVPASGEGGTLPNKEGWQCMGLFGKSGIDSGIRIESTSPEWGVTHWLQNAQVWNNGKQARKFSRGVVTASAFMMSSEIEASTAVGHYWGSTSYPRGFWGDVAEIIVYNRQFDEDERKFVEAYLAKKWGVDIGLGEQDKLVDLLPPQSDVSVAEGATLELNGADQSFTSLSGAGDIVNNSETVSVVTLSSGALDGFAGTIGGNITLKIIGDVTIPEGVTIAPSVNLILANGVVLDLDGRNVTVNNASGSGIVRNGELTVLGENNLTDPGTMIIIR
jgi:autotransporter-associated beta strand protein